MSTWEDVKGAWSEGWRALSVEGVTRYAAELMQDPSKYLDQIQGFVSSMIGARTDLDAIASALPNPPQTAEDQALIARAAALERRYQDLAAGLLADAWPSEPATGAVPLLVIAGLAIGVVGCAWAVVAYEYMVNLREQTALLRADLDARVQAMETGKTLPASNLPPPPKPPEDPDDLGGLIGWLLVGGLVLGAGAAFLPTLLKKE